MFGITTIQEIPVYGYTWGFSGFGLFLGLVTIFWFILAIACRLKLRLDDSGWLFFLTFFLMSASIIAFKNGTEYIDHYNYQVIIDENVSMQEFTNKYEIIEQQGISYIVQEKGIKAD